MYPAQIAATVKVRDVKISPNGQRILYQVQSFYKPDDRFLAELWVAQTGVAQSARQLTDGRFYDKSAVFHPTQGDQIIFLSDRWSVGKAANLYSLNIDEAGALPAPVMDEPVKKGVQQFQISPDGRYLAFTSSRTNVCEAPPYCDEKRIGDRAPGLAGLFLFDFDTKETRPLSAIRADRHVESFTWAPDSTEVLYRLRKDKTPEAAEEEVRLEKVSITDLIRAPVPVGSFARSPSGPNLWLGSGHIVSLQNYEDDSILDARAMFVHREGSAWRKKSWVRKLYGVTEDAVRIVDMGEGEGPTSGTSMIAVEVCFDTDTRIDGIVFAPAGRGDECDVVDVIPLFHTQNDAIWFGAWDARRCYTGEDMSYVFSAVLSSGVRHEAPNVWSVVPASPCHVGVNGAAANGVGARKTCLSSHLRWLVNEPHTPTEIIRWKAKDGIVLSGLIRYPPKRNAQGRWPTVMFLHGGPYRRDVPDYMPYFCNWREMLASAGYLVISPNYRGSQGRGHDFVYSANKGIGALDWSDCESMLDEVIARGIADPNRLGIAGWSHGGSMTAWGVTETKTRFRAAVVGAGVSNWESMVMEAGSPELEAAIGGVRPWASKKESPVHKVEGVSTAVLILHGEKDERIPLAQGLGLYRGLRKSKATVEMVVYPREPHGFVEKKHAENVMQRVLDHFDRWL